MERIGYRLGERDLVWNAARATAGVTFDDLSTLRSLLAAGGRGRTFGWDRQPSAVRLMERALAQPTATGDAVVITDQGLAVLDAVDTSCVLVERAIQDPAGPKGEALAMFARSLPGARIGDDRRALPRRTAGRRSTDPGSRP